MLQQKNRKIFSLKKLLNIQSSLFPNADDEWSKFAQFLAESFEQIHTVTRPILLKLLTLKSRTSKNFWFKSVLQKIENKVKNKTILNWKDQRRNFVLFFIHFFVFLLRQQTNCKYFVTISMKYWAGQLNYSSSGKVKKQTNK